MERVLYLNADDSRKESRECSLIGHVMVSTVSLREGRRFCSSLSRSERKHTLHSGGREAISKFSKKNISPLSRVSRKGYQSVTKRVFNTWKTIHFTCDNTEDVPKLRQAKTSTGARWFHRTPPPMDRQDHSPEEEKATGGTRHLERQKHVLRS